MKWLRWHHGTYTDPKWRVAARRSGQPVPAVIAVWAAMLETASEANTRGQLDGWDDEVVAAALDLDPDDVTAIREAMQGLVLDGDELTGWDRRQPDREDSTSTERVRRHRNRQRKRTQGNADETQVKRDETQRNAPEESRGDKEEITSSSTIPVSIDPPTPRDAGIEEDEEEVQAIFEMTEAVVAHVEKAPNETAARRFMAASDGITTGLSSASWRDHTGAQVPWRDRPNLLKLALIKCEAEGGWDSNSLHSALKYTILQQRNPTPAPDFARRRERTADPPKRATFEERIAELEKALPYIRRQSLDPFEGGLPSVDVLFIGPEDYGAWDAVLRKNGLKTIAEMREAAA